MYFVGSPNDWKSLEFPLQTVPHRDTEKYRIRFESDYAVQCYESYMAHNCHVCQKRYVGIRAEAFKESNRRCKCSLNKL